MPRTTRAANRNQSAGLLLFRRKGLALEVLLVHPGGPFWAKRDNGAWSIPKGLIGRDEDPEAAARREFAEETGYAPKGESIALGSIRQPGGKTVHAWALEGDWDPSTLVSNSFALEWPPKSGRTQSFPEVDRAEWLTIAAARKKILKGQAELLDRLASLVGVGE